MSGNINNFWARFRLLKRVHPFDAEEMCLATGTKYGQYVWLKRRGYSPSKKNINKWLRHIGLSELIFHDQEAFAAYMNERATWRQPTKRRVNGLSDFCSDWSSGSGVRNCMKKSR
tara:strand:- start:247 stop:591 length:345 start_codon:yes stop_codon:yes gene_type:complete